jgi:hypothetical protein
VKPGTAQNLTSGELDSPVTPAEGECVQETRLREKPDDAGSKSRQPWYGPDSLMWLILVSVLFLLSELLPALLRLPLGADEITYIARTSARASGVMLPPVHGHGAGLLAAPVTLATTSLLALRIWMAVLSALGLFGSLLCWRGLRPTWVLAVAGIIFGSLAITELSGVQVYPDLWAAFGALAITGLVLQSVTGRMRPRIALPLIGFLAFFIVLLRPQNIAFVLAPTFLAPIVVRGWRQPKVLIAMVIGIAVGLLEWTAEASLWFGGLASRIHLANGEPPKLGLNFSLPMQVKVLSGPWYCETSKQCPDVNYPAFIVWWLLLIALVGLGLWAAWRLPTKASSVLAVVTGVWAGGLYLVFVPFGAPRYMLPTWAMFAIVAADGIAWLVTVPSWRRVGVGLACAFLLTGVVTQHIVLVRETANQHTVRPFIAKADYIRKLGIRPPCAMDSPSVGYYLGCQAPWTGMSMQQFLKRTPGGAKAWREIQLPGGQKAWDAAGLPDGAPNIWVPR